MLRENKFAVGSLMAEAKKITGANSIFAIGGVSFSADSSVIKKIYQILV